MQYCWLSNRVCLSLGKNTLAMIFLESKFAKSNFLCWSTFCENNLSWNFSQKCKTNPPKAAAQTMFIEQAKKCLHFCALLNTDLYTNRWRTIHMLSEKRRHTQNLEWRKLNLAWRQLSCHTNVYQTKCLSVWWYISYDLIFGSRVYRNFASQEAIYEHLKSKAQLCNMENWRQ